MPYKDIKTQRKFDNIWMQARRNEWLEHNGPCMMCFSDDKLEIHHVIPEIKRTHRIWSYTKTKRDRELANCVALCHSCHKRITQKKLRWNKFSIDKNKVIQIYTDLANGMRLIDASNKYNVPYKVVQRVKHLLQ